MDLIALSAAKNYANKVTAGFKSVEINGMNLIFTLLDDTKATITLPTPANGKDGENGISVQNLSIDKDGSLLCHMSDGAVIDAGKVPMTDIELTDYYTKEEIETITGKLENLSTEDKANIVNAINEVFDKSKESVYIPFEQLGNYARTVTLESYGTYYLDYPDDVTTITVYCKAGGKNYNRTVKGGGVLIYMPSNVNGYQANGALLHIGWAGWYYFGPTTQRYDAASHFKPGLLLDTTKEQTITGKKTFDTLPESSLVPTSDSQLVNKKYVDDSIVNIDIPETDLTNYYSKSEIGNLSSLAGWTTGSTAVGYFKNNPGIYDMMITLDIDTTTKDISVPSSQTAIILEMIKAHHRDKCFWLNLHAPSQSNGNHTLIPVHLSRFQNGETWKQVIPSFHFYEGELHIRNVEFETFTPVNGDNEPISLKVRLLAETANSTIATKNDIAAAVSNISIPDMTNYYTKEETKTTYLGLPIFEIPTEISEIQSWITENIIPYATKNGWDSFYLKFNGLSADTEQNYFKGLYLLEAFYDISEEDSRDWKTYYFKSISGYVHTVVDGADDTDFATMYPAISLHLNADNSVRHFETASVSDISMNSAAVLRTDIDYKTPYIPVYDGNPATKLYVDNKVAAIRTPQSHDGEGMIGWYGTAVAGDNLTELYGVTPDMVRAVKAGDYISWPSRVQTGATENTICLYNMTYEVYNKDEMENLETIDIKIGKSPDTTYTYVIVGDNVYKETF